MNEAIKSFGLGKIVALVILLLVIILGIIGRMAGLEAWLIGGLAAAIVLL